MRDQDDQAGVQGPADAVLGGAERPACRKILFSAMKNEAPFVLEWIAYHKAIGFDEIVVCSNPSNDGMEELLAALAEAGEITHLRVTVPKDASPQFAATQAFTQTIGFNEGDWYMWLDADEFLNIHVGNRTVQALIDQISDKQCALINWRIFGSSGHNSFPGQFIDSAFSRASNHDFGLNRVVKSIFKYSSNIQGFARSGIHRPLVAKGATLSASDVMVGSGEEASKDNARHARWLRGDDFVLTASVPNSECGWSIAQINHYSVRTKDMYALKRLRGRGYKANSAGDANRRHTDTFYSQHDRNEAEDRSILHWAEATADGIARLLRNPTIASATAVSSALLKDLMSQITPPAPVADPPTEVASTFKLTFPEAERAYVQAVYREAGVILEYGSGGSTVLAAELGRTVFSVESDKAWAARLTDHLASISDKAMVHYADIGPTGAWGAPARARDFRKFPGYALSVWDRPDFQEPDLVLIDGRFRASCLVAVMLRAKKPVTVLFDDYDNRGYYHGVEKLARKEEMIGRMARFTVTPGAIPPDMVTEAIGWFTDQR